MILGFPFYSFELHTEQHCRLSTLQHSNTPNHYSTPVGNRICSLPQAKCNQHCQNARSPLPPWLSLDKISHPSSHFKTNDLLLIEKSKNSQADHQDRCNAAEDGEKIADRVIETVKKRIEKRKSKSGAKKNPRKKKTTHRGFEIDVSDDEDDDDEIRGKKQSKMHRHRHLHRRLHLHLHLLHP